MREVGGDRVGLYKIYMSHELSSTKHLLNGPSDGGTPPSGLAPTTEVHLTESRLAPEARRTRGGLNPTYDGRQLPTGPADRDRPSGAVCRFPLVRSQGLTSGPNISPLGQPDGGGVWRDWTRIIIAWTIWLATWLITRRKAKNGVLRGLSGSTPHSPSEGAREAEPEGAVRRAGRAESEGKVPSPALRSENVVAVVLDRGSYLSSAADPPSHHESRWENIISTAWASPSAAHSPLPFRLSTPTLRVAGCAFFREGLKVLPS